MYNIYKAHYLQFNMLCSGMHEQKCAMHSLYDCFANVCRFLRLYTICVEPVLATVFWLNFNMYTGFQLKINENYHLIQSHLTHSYSG